MVDLKGQYDNIKPEIDHIIQEVINNSSFIGGTYVKRFSENLAEYLNVKHVIPCGNGTDALQLAMMALELEPGSEVITTPFTFVATVEVLCLMGLKPVFVDVEPDSFNINPALLEEAITPNTKAIVPVHLFGQAADMQPILDIAKKHGLYVVEDTAQAISAQYKIDGQEPQYCGTMGDIGTFSFFPSKNLGCYGDGGAICTNNEVLAQKMKLYANHGSVKKYTYTAVGINSRLDGLQAGILDVKLKHLDKYVTQRQEAAALYDELLGSVEGVIIPARMTKRNHVFHQYTVQLAGDRDKISAYLKSKSVPHGIYYPSSLHNQAIYAHFTPEGRSFPVCEQLCNTVISLPMHTELNQKMQEYIVSTLQEALIRS